MAQLVLQSAVTAVAFSPEERSTVAGEAHAYLIGVGTEDGRIELFAKPTADDNVWETVHSVDERCAWDHSQLVSERTFFRVEEWS